MIRARRKPWLSGRGMRVGAALAGLVAAGMLVLPGSARGGRGVLYADDRTERNLPYKEPGKEEKEKGTFTLKEYERHMAAPPAKITGMERDLLTKGCVGLCRVRQGIPGDEEYPDKAPGVQCWQTLGEARNKRCDECWRLFVFAKQGTWKDGKPIKTSPVPPESVTRPYNYATYFDTDGGTWKFMNSNACEAEAAGHPQEVYVRGKLPAGMEATIYCSVCIFGWHHPSAKVPGCFSKTVVDPLLWEGRVTDKTTGKSHLTPTCPAEPPAECD